ncbi:caspase family protein, partial [bacterium]|nr:caspase family protein [bacterium]
MVEPGDKAIANLRKNAHAVIIGINEYQDPKIPNLSFARADAKGIYDIMIDPDLGRIAADNVILLLDENATERQIRTALAIELPKRAAEDDLVYIYFAGHGSPVIDSRSQASDGIEKYLIPSDAEIDRLRATGISMDEIHRCFGWIDSKQVLFFIDSCYSGEAGGRTFSNTDFRKRATINDDFLNDLAGEGRLVMTACDVNELSLEMEERGHGLFTYYLIKGLKGVADKDRDGFVTVPELYEYVYENVSQQARKMGGSMHPIQKGSIRGTIYLTRYETDL